MAENPQPKNGHCITMWDIKVYKTLNGKYRAYLESAPSVEAWGYGKNNAVANLARLMGEKNIPFNLTNPGETPNERQARTWAPSIQY
jgi:hypothetical protein